MDLIGHMLVITLNLHLLHNQDIIRLGSVGTYTSALHS